MRTANLAIVFTDVHGFNERTSRQTLEQNQRLLKAHSDLLRPMFGAFDGKVIKAIGDAFLVTFESPTQAVLCGAAIQDRLWHYNRTAPELERLDVRVAVNVGEVRLEGSDVFGEPVNIAARVQALTQPGEIYFTEAVYLAMNKAEVPSTEVGTFELKGIPGKVRVFKVPRAPYRVEAPAAAPEGEKAEQPPYGNLGLARVQDALRTEKFVAATAAMIGQTANAAGKLMEGTQQALSKVGRRRLSRPVLLGGIAVVLALGLIFALRGSEFDRALNAIDGAPDEQARGEQIRKAQALIHAEKDPGTSAYMLGRLDEALGAPGRAIRSYQEAAQRGQDDGADRLVELLSHPECRVRQAAAGAVGNLRLRSARGALEDLAEEGGPGEEDIPLIGCNSRKAAEQALRALE